MNLRITFEDTTYTLGYTRNTIRRMEKAGFVIEDIERFPVSSLEDLFAGAFLLHHSNVKTEKIKEILKHLSNKEGLFAKLVSMYTESSKTLLNEPDEGDEKKATWEEMN